MKLPRPMRQKLPVVLVAGLGGFFTVVDVACAQPWTATTAPNLPWTALASSADGTRLVAAASAGGYFGAPPAPIYASTDAGATWTQTGAPSNNWTAVACSADGVKWVAVTAPNWYSGDGLIYTSPDSGATWMRTSAPSNTWSAVASSADGIKLVAVARTGDQHYGGDGLIYTSSNSGASWTPTSAPTNDWTSVASSADGVKLVAVANPEWYNIGAIYTSSNSGASWTPTTAPTKIWTSIAVSADGTKWVAAAELNWVYDGNGHGHFVSDGAIDRSPDSGATWIRTTAPTNYWTSVASSADGTKLVAGSANPVLGDGRIYSSSDSGATWTATEMPRGYWTAVASSADGYRVAAGVTSNDPSMLLCTLLCIRPYSGLWRLADAPVNSWESVASSADGTKLVAVAVPYWDGDKYGNGGIYRSLDSGDTWIRTGLPSSNWFSVACSADGTKLVAVSSSFGPINGRGDGWIYTSPDSGTTWTPTTAPTNTWSSVASAADGTRLVAVAAPQWVWDGNGKWHYVGDGAIYRSLDSGVTWTPASAPSNSWSAIASSADGTKWVAVAAALQEWNGTVSYYAGDGAIYRSLDSGATWTRTSAPSNNWTSVASSVDGTKWVAAAAAHREVGRLKVDDGGIYRSLDSGATWTRTSAPSKNWTSVASSAAGTQWVAVSGEDPYSHSFGGYIYVSRDSGATWTPAGAPAVNFWQAVASSADGSTLVAGAGGHAGLDGPICILRSPAPTPPLPPSPQLAVSWSGATLGLSWLVPSTRFVLQQNSDLGSTNWVEVPTPPMLDYTNLHHRLTLTPSLNGSYFRLKQQ